MVSELDVDDSFQTESRTNPISHHVHQINSQNEGKCVPMEKYPLVGHSDHHS